MSILSETAGGGAMATIKTGAATAIEFMTQAFTAMTGNEYLTVFLAVTMIGAGVCLFRKLRRGT